MTENSWRQLRDISPITWFLAVVDVSCWVVQPSIWPVWVLLSVYVWCAAWYDIQRARIRRAKEQAYEDAFAAWEKDIEEND